MGVRGIDISNHQAGMDVERVVRENNIGFVFVLSNDGTFKNIYYQAQMAAARRGGAIAVPYIYLRTNVDQTFATFRQQEPNPRPVIVDVEDGSGARPECDRMHSLLHGAGYTTPLLYWPDWYRKKVGSPSLAGLPPLWTSWYPDYVNRGFDAGLAQLPAWVWNGYGGLPTLIAQFTSSGRLSGYGGNLDLNYYPGTREELARLIGGSQEGEDEMTVDELLDTPIPQEFSAEIGEALGIEPDADGRYFKPGVSLRVLFAWSDNRHESLKAEVEQAQRELAEVKAKIAAPAPVSMTEADRDAIAAKVVAGMAGVVRNTMQTLQVNVPSTTATFSPKPPIGQ